MLVLEPAHAGDQALVVAVAALVAGGLEVVVALADPVVPVLVWVQALGQVRALAQVPAPHLAYLAAVAPAVAVGVQQVPLVLAVLAAQYLEAVIHKTTPTNQAPVQQFVCSFGGSSLCSLLLS